jgi:hypothetical protein
LGITTMPGFLPEFIREFNGLELMNNVSSMPEVFNERLFYNVCAVFSTGFIIYV